MTRTSNPIKIDSKGIAQEFLNLFDTFLFDCDGVIWLGGDLLPNVKETLDMLTNLGKQLIFVTNNSTKSRVSYVKKFASFGISITKDQIFTSGYASSLYIRDYLKLTPGKDKIWVFGEGGIIEELNLMGFETLGGNDPRLDEPFDPQTCPFLVNELDKDVKCVVTGLDTKINYHRLSVTLQYLQQSSVHFVATNIDSTFPRKGLKLPGAGSMIQSLIYSSERTPEICGKPNLNKLSAIISTKNLNKDMCCMVGDRLNTDIKFGVDGGLGGTLLVLTGIETEENALDPNGPYQRPKFYANKLGDLYELLR